MPLTINTDHADFKQIKSDLHWRELVRAQQEGGDVGFDKKWAELYGESGTEKPPMKDVQ